MTALRALVAGLLLTALAPLASAQGDEENGGVIILLHSNYRFVTGQGACQTLVIVAPDSDVQDCEYRLQSEGDIKAVRVSGAGIDMRLRTVDSNCLEGRLIDTDEPVLVCSQTYAESHWNIGG